MQKGEDIVLSITDEGPGVKLSDLDRIFEIFYRGGCAARRPGTGVGQSICGGFIDTMGGQIVAHSPAVQRRGTRIVIRITSAHSRPVEMEPKR